MLKHPRMKQEVEWDSLHQIHLRSGDSSNG